MRLYNIAVDGKLHAVSLPTPVAEGSNLRATVNGKDVIVVFSRVSKLELTGMLRVQTRAFHIDFSSMRDPTLPTVRVDGRPFVVELRELPTQSSEKETVTRSIEPMVAPHGVIVAPMPGRVMSLRVRRGDSVRAGQPLLMLEAMKMENEIAAPTAGTIKEIWVEQGTSVNRGQRLLEIS